MVIKADRSLLTYYPPTRAGAGPKSTTDRTRIRDLGAHEMLLGLGFASMTAAALADQRRQLGVHAEPLVLSLASTPSPSPSSPGARCSRAMVDPQDPFSGTEVPIGV